MFGIFVNRKNVIVILMSIELILLAVNINLVAFSAYLHEVTGQIFAMFVLTVAAAEAAVGLAILVTFFRNRGDIAVDDAIDDEGVGRAMTPAASSSTDPGASRRCCGAVDRRACSAAGSATSASMSVTTGLLFLSCALGLADIFFSVVCGGWQPFTAELAPFIQVGALPVRPGACASTPCRR